MCEIMIFYTISTLFLGFGIAILIFNIRMYTYTKNNPFKDKLPSTLEEREEKYFYVIQSSLDQIHFTSFNQKQCICDNEILNDFCTEEQIQAGCKDIALNQNKNLQSFLRFLEKDFSCENYKNKILNVDYENLGEIFILNFNIINKMALVLIILTIIAFSIFIAIIIAECRSFTDDSHKDFYFAIIPYLLLSAVGNIIAELILFIILCIKYEYSKIPDYIEFLNCDDVRRSSFKYPNIEKVKSTYMPFMVLYIIFFIINLLNVAFSYCFKQLHGIISKHIIFLFCLFGCCICCCL